MVFSALPAKAGWLVACERERHASRIYARRYCIPGAARQDDSRSHTYAALLHDQDRENRFGMPSFWRIVTPERLRDESPRHRF